MPSKMQLHFSYKPFVGFSWLMTSPDVCYQPFAEGLELLSCKSDEPKLELYAQAAAFVDEIDADAKRDFTFYRTGNATFHVTWLDGVNQSNVGSLDPEKKEELNNALQRPERIFTYLPTLSVPKEIRFPTVEMEFDKLAIWGDGGVLVATLRPVAGSEELFEDIKEMRRDLDRTMMDELGKPLAHNYTPHLTLGYFGVPEIGKAAKKCLPTWNKLAKKKMTAPISFKGAEAHYFLDMVRFVRSSLSKGEHVLAMPTAPHDTALVRACSRVRLWDMPESTKWSLTPPELRTIERLVKETPTTILRPKQIFVAWNAVLTVAFEYFSAELFSLKCGLNTSIPRLKEENPGALWPKVSFASLNDGRVLTNTEANTLYQICKTIDDKLARLGPLSVKELSVVAFRCRNLASRYLTHRIALATSSSTQLSPGCQEAFETHRLAVADMLAALSPREIFHGIEPFGARLSRYLEPHSEFTLAADIRDDGLRGCIKEFRQQVAFWLPGSYTFFPDDSLHLTIRGLMPK